MPSGTSAPARMRAASSTTSRKVPPHQQPGHVRHHQANQPDHPADRHRRRGHQRGREHHRQAQAPHIDTQRPRLLIAKRQQVQPPAQQTEHYQPGTDRRAGRRQIGPAHGGQTAHQPEGDGRQRVGRIGGKFHQRHQGGEDGADNHPGEDQHQHVVAVAGAPTGDQPGHRHRREPGQKRAELNAARSRAEQNGQRGAEPGPRRNPQNIRRDKGIAEDALKGRPGHRQCRPDQQPRDNPRQADGDHHDVGRVRRVDRQCQQVPGQNLRHRAGRQRIASDQQREKRRQQRQQHEQQRRARHPLCPDGHVGQPAHNVAFSEKVMVRPAPISSPSPLR